MQALNQNLFWHNKRVLVTGHTGFKGAWLSHWLIQMGAEVIGYALKPSTTPNLFDLTQLASKMIHIEGDVSDGNHLNKVFAQYKPEIVLHLAAQALVLDSYDDPINTYQTNVMGTLQVFEAARHSGHVRVIVNVTSDKCYENKEQDRAYTEADPMGGFDPYSSSKGCSEILTSAYRRSYFSDDSIRLVSARAGNCIGGGDWSKDRIIPDIIRAYSKGESVTIRSPNATRPWQHVLEPLYGYLLLAQNAWSSDDFSQGWNLGPDPESVASVSWVIEEAAKILGPDFQYAMNPNASKHHEAKLLKLDPKKAQTFLNWQPQLTNEAAMQWTFQWYLAHKQGLDMMAFTKQQINDYMSQITIPVKSNEEIA